MKFVYVLLGEEEFKKTYGAPENWSLENSFRENWSLENSFRLVGAVLSSSSVECKKNVLAGLFKSIGNFNY